MNDKEEKEIWLGFAKAAIQSYEIPEDIENLEELVDDIADMSGNVADAMVEKFKERFDGPRRAGGRRRREREEPEEKD